MAIMIDNRDKCCCTIRPNTGEYKIEVVETQGFVSPVGKAHELYDCKGFTPGFKYTFADLWALRCGFETLGVYTNEADAFAAYDELIEKLKINAEYSYIETAKDNRVKLRVSGDKAND